MLESLGGGVSARLDSESGRLSEARSCVVYEMLRSVYFKFSELEADKHIPAMKTWWEVSAVYNIRQDTLEIDGDAVWEEDRSWGVVRSSGFSRRWIRAAVLAARAQNWKKFARKQQTQHAGGGGDRCPASPDGCHHPIQGTLFGKIIRDQNDAAATHTTNGTKVDFGGGAGQSASGSTAGSAKAKQSASVGASYMGTGAHVSGSNENEVSASSSAQGSQDVNAHLSVDMQSTKKQEQQASAGGECEGMMGIAWVCVHCMKKVEFNAGGMADHLT